MDEHGGWRRQSRRAIRGARLDNWAVIILKLGQSPIQSEQFELVTNIHLLTAASLDYQIRQFFIVRVSHSVCVFE